MSELMYFGGTKYVYERDSIRWQEGESMAGGEEHLCCKPCETMSSFNAPTDKPSRPSPCTGAADGAI